MIFNYLSLIDNYYLTTITNITRLAYTYVIVAIQYSRLPQNLHRFTNDYLIVRLSLKKFSVEFNCLKLMLEILCE